MNVYEEEIETARLTLERCTAGNVTIDELFAVFDAEREGVERELRYLPWEPHETVYDTKQWVDEQDRRWRECEGATYAMRANDAMDVETGTLVGVTTFETYWERKAGEQMIFLRKPFYGQGLFAESAYEFLDHAFHDMGLELMIADAVEGNERARSIFQNGVDAFGGQYDGVLRNRLPTPEGVKDVHRYTVTREQYRRTMGLVDDADDADADADDTDADDADADDADADDADADDVDTGEGAGADDATDLDAPGSDEDDDEPDADRDEVPASAD